MGHFELKRNKMLHCTQKMTQFLEFSLQLTWMHLVSLQGMQLLLPLLMVQLLRPERQRKEEIGRGDVLLKNALQE